MPRIEQATPSRLPWLFTALLLASLGASVWLTPRDLMMPNPPKLVDVIPKEFGDWRVMETTAQQVSPYYVGEGTPETGLGPYSDILARSYINSKGQVVHLMLAYVNKMTQELKVHRPELCYTADGYVLSNFRKRPFPSLDAFNTKPTGVSMLAEKGGNVEAISYWIRVGDVYSTSAWATRQRIFAAGIGNTVLDGILVRASTPVEQHMLDEQLAHALQDVFMAQLIPALSTTAARMLVH